MILSSASWVFPGIIGCSSFGAEGSGEERCLGAGTTVASEPSATKNPVLPHGLFFFPFRLISELASIVQGDTMSAEAQGSEPLHKACDACRARKTRCRESIESIIGRKPNRRVTNL